MLKNKPSLGMGVYMPPDISLILNIPKWRIRWYIDEVWDNRFGKEIFNERYSWNIRNHKAVNFLVLVEFKVVLELKKMGLPIHKIFLARNSIAKEQKLPYPFASSRLYANAKRIWYNADGTTYDADGSRQQNFENFIEDYYKCIDFKDEIANRFYPRGKNNSVVVDPHRQLGQPIIEGTNIPAETIYSMYEAGDSIPLLSNIYDLPEKKIKDAIEFYNKAA
jgi:uncharacterized protein (DUF433 family)